MKLSKMVINNFRSLKKVEFCPGNFNIFVGQNNHGKPILLKQLSGFTQAKVISERLNIVMPCAKRMFQLS